MKKRIFALLLAISCLASMVVAPANAAEIAAENMKQTVEQIFNLIQAIK